MRIHFHFHTLKPGVWLNFLLCEPPHDKTNKMTVRPAKTQISLGIRPVWSESSLSAWRKLGSLATHWAHSEDSDQTGRMPRLIWVFAGRTVILLVLSWTAQLYRRVTGRFAHFPVRPESFRPESFRPRVVSPSITWVVSPSYPESFRPLFGESFRQLSKFIFYWGYCDKFTVFVSFINEDFVYISLKKWYVLHQLKQMIRILVFRLSWRASWVIKMSLEIFLYVIMTFKIVCNFLEHFMFFFSFFYSDTCICLGISLFDRG